MYCKTICAFLLVALLLCAPSASAQTAFTHHGNLGFSASGQYDFELRLFDTPTTGTGTQQGSTFPAFNITVTNGDFILTSIDFGAAVFTGGELFLETGWRVSGGGVFTVLSPREKITAVYANRSLSAAAADNATQLGGLPVTSFIQNTTTQQGGSFNVAGDGTAGGTLSGNTVNAATQFNLGGSRILSNAGTSNLFAGVGAGASNTTGSGNSFFGNQAGYSGTTAGANSFFGFEAGYATTTGSWNAFFGTGAGLHNTIGYSNSFFGPQAGYGNTTGAHNSFFGANAGINNTSGQYNDFFGWYAGMFNTTGSYNAVFGNIAGTNLTTEQQNTFIGMGAGSWTGTNDTASNANYNTFVGTLAGLTNYTGSSNTALGRLADVGANNLTNATAIGANASVGQSNSLVLGSINGLNGAAADTKVGIGTTTPSFRLHVVDPSNTGLRVQTNITGGTVASFGGNGDFQIDAPGVNGGRFIVKENGNVGIGSAAAVDRLVVNGKIRVLSLGTAGSTQLCFNLSSQISTCSSSLRYKTNIAPFSAGLSLINRLQPITFNWKGSGEADLGLGAEDVAKVEPLLVTHNQQGEVEGVKYDRVAVILLNAVKQQQAQITDQQQQIEALKQIICVDHPRAQMCTTIPRTTIVSWFKKSSRLSDITSDLEPVRQIGKNMEEP